MEIPAFQQLVIDYYNAHGRHTLPWRMLERGQSNPYHIVVSELMLQQTQVARVIPKYQQFLAAYPDFDALAGAPLADVLRLWNGLGYNRRAKFLWQTASTVTQEYNGILPADQAALVRLPGIGPHTAGAIRAYAFNQPAVFIETNIRTVYLHHFFPKTKKVPDSLILPFIERSVPETDPRSWYWALMDYGSHLKQTVGNVARASSGYKKQSAFQGSRRQVRGQVLRLLAGGALSTAALRQKISDERLPGVLVDLCIEGFICLDGDLYKLGT